MIFFPTFRKITVGGFVNQLHVIKKFWPYFVYGSFINPYKPSILFVGHPQSKTRSDVAKCGI